MRWLWLALVACSGTPPGKTQPYVEAKGSGSGVTADTIVVTVNELRDNDGTVRCFLYNSPEEFPDSVKHIISSAVALPANKVATCTFERVPQNHDYAIVMLHDENNDNQLQKNAIGIPTEGYGFSNNAKARFSAPSFDDCKFHFATGTLPMTIATRY
jgi:uncharacterized protein (DUF2141 family)